MDDKWELRWEGGHWGQVFVCGFVNNAGVMLFHHRLPGDERLERATDCICGASAVLSEAGGINTRTVGLYHAELINARSSEFVFAGYGRGHRSTC